MAYLYRHIRKDINQPFYIGIGSDNDGKFKRAYQKFSYKRNQHWHNIVNKTEYEVEIVMDDLTWEEACLKEIEFIELYGRTDLDKGPLVNKTRGGEGTVGSIHPHTEETKLKISLSTKGIKKHSEETKIKMKNRIFSDETKRKMKGRVPWNKGLSGIITGVKQGTIRGKYKKN